MKSLLAVVMAVCMLLLQTGSIWAQQARGDAERIRQLEEELLKLQQEQERLKKTLEDIKKETTETRKEAIETRKEATESNLLLQELKKIKVGASITLRYDQTEVEDQTDLLLEDNQIEGLRTRIRLSVEYTPIERLTAAVRLSTGEDPNPTSPFIPLGNTFRSRSFNLDQFYFIIRPLKSFEPLTSSELLKPLEDASFTLGKMPLPFWRGDRGTWRSEMIWDDDISPEGIVFQTPIPTGLSFLRIDNTVGYFSVSEVTDLRFTGLTGDTYLVADQLKLGVEPLPATGVTAAVAVYHYQNLNAGLRSPSFVPGSSAFVSPGTNAILMREGLQRTNNRITFGPGAEGFVASEFTFLNFTGQAYVTLPAHWLERVKLAFLRPEIFVTGDYVNNLRVSQEDQGYGITVGLRGGGQGKVAPFNIWYTYRDVSADATLSAFADSDLGAGTAYRGFEFGANYRLLRNLLAQFSYLDFEGFPRKDNGVTRWFFDLVYSF
jgi:hypothetical protein